MPARFALLTMLSLSVLTCLPNTAIANPTSPAFRFNLHMLSRANGQPQVIDPRDSGCTPSDLKVAGPVAQALTTLVTDLRSKASKAVSSDARAPAIVAFSPRVVSNANGTAAIELLPDFSDSTVRAFFNCAYVSYAEGNAAKDAGLFVPGAADSQRGAFVLNGWYGLYVIS
jgi:hypothetical protein